MAELWVPPDPDVRPPPEPRPEDDEWAQTYRDAGYEYCRPHGEWHRGSECEIDENGDPDPWWNRIDDEPDEVGP
jgi:hypothetical protein